MTNSTTLRYRMTQGVKVPLLIYGTAWKEEGTSELTSAALRAGFRGIDTANQRKHYFEAGVGEAVSGAFAEELLTRDELFIQTKFTYIPGQDHRLPYDPAASIAEQVHQSCASSREHLGVEVIDSYLLHGPSSRFELTETDWQAWGAMEKLQDEGRVKLLGISNVHPDQLEALLEKSVIKPSLVQNRCFAATAWDQRVRKICEAHGIGYQGFSLLTANRAVVVHPDMQTLAQKYGKSPAQIIFRFALQVGMLVLTGTTSTEHMAQDLNIFDFTLEESELAAIEIVGLD